ncbi:MAG: hypothetical protein Ct9H90mP3_7330 [Flammeovirgaceae bacterium]|nr:MAG: hypothetical protein Ct9H90mP3_7330 [Flammeovirgaceae bacterium]
MGNGSSSKTSKNAPESLPFSKYLIISDSF